MIIRLLLKSRQGKNSLVYNNDYRPLALANESD